MDPSAGPPSYRGATASEITLGVLVSTNSTETLDTVGFDVDTGDAIGQVEAMRAWVNAHGGMSGRNVEIVFHDRDTASTQPADVQSQAACDDFTHDHTVYAVMTFFVGAGMASCLADRDTALIDSSVIALFDSATYRELGPYYFTPPQISIDRYLTYLVPGLARQGFFDDPQARYGMVYADTPSSHAAVRDALKPALAEIGVELTSEFAVTPGTTLEGGASQGREMQNAVLRFRSAGVDHVMFLYPACACLFMTAAEGQAYRPRYGLGTYDSPASTQGLVSPAQLQAAVGVGFMPVADVNAQQQDAPVNDREELCLTIMREAGMTPDSQATRISMLAHCDMFLFTKQVLDAATDLSPAGFAGTAEGLGTSYLSPLVYQVRIGPDRHDGPAAMRPFEFDSTCNCFSYNGPPYDIG